MPIFSYHSALFKLSNVHVTAGAEVAVDAVAVVVLAVATGVEAAIPESAFWSSAFVNFVMLLTLYLGHFVLVQ